MPEYLYKLLPVCLAVIALVGCAAPTTRQTELSQELIRQEEEKQKQLALQKDMQYEERLQRVAWPILQAGVPLCAGNTLPRLGMKYANLSSFDDEYRDAAREVFGLGERVQVIIVAPGAPGDRAGIKAGDILVRANGEDVPTGKKAVQEFGKYAEKALAAGSTVSLDLRRNDEAFSVEVTGEDVCRFSVQLLPTDELNAFADGNAIYITRGMMRFAIDDNDLAVVIGHELAHNSQEHIKAKMKNYWLGAIFDIAAAAYGVNTQGTIGNMAAQSYSKEFEAEADYVGLYMLALAGYDLTEVADFWRQFGGENPGSITRSYASSHPSTAERYLAIDNAVREIQMKEGLGEELRPELKK